MVLSQGNIVYSRELFLRLKWLLCLIIPLLFPIHLFSNTVRDGLAKSTNNLFLFRVYSIIRLPYNYDIEIQKENNRKLVDSFFALTKFIFQRNYKYFLTDTSRSEVLVVK